MNMMNGETEKKTKTTTLKITNTRSSMQLMKFPTIRKTTHSRIEEYFILYIFYFILN